MIHSLTQIAGNRIRYLQIFPQLPETNENLLHDVLRNQIILYKTKCTIIQHIRVLSKKVLQSGGISPLHFFEKDQLIWHKTIGIISIQTHCYAKKGFYSIPKKRKNHK